MNLNNILSTNERIKILENIIYKVNLISVNAISRDLRLSKGLISKYLDILRKENILKKTKNKYIVINNLNTKSLKILLNINKFNIINFKKYKYVKSVGLYGSCAKGENNENSDIDVYIITNKEDISELTRELNKLGNINPLYLTKEKINLLKKNDKVFYNALFFGSIIIYGENEI